MKTKYTLFPCGILLQRACCLSLRPRVVQLKKLETALLRKIIFINCALAWLPAVLGYGRSASPAGVPLLDEMAGTWLPMKDVVNPPDVNNFHDMLLVNRDLTSFFCCPEDWLWRDGKFRFGYPPVALTSAGKVYPAMECRWYPYRACRRQSNSSGVVV